MKKHELNFGHWQTLYPKVDMIRGRKISPEIDILSVDHESKTLTGYELKFLNKRKDTNYRLVRESLGQAIEYFQFGLDRSYIVLGIPIRGKGLKDYIGTSILDLITVVRALRWAYNFDSLGIQIWFEDRDKIQTSQEPKRNFPLNMLKSKQFDGCRLDRNCLFSASFHWDLGFLKKYGLHVPGFWSKTFPRHKSSASNKRHKKS